MNLFCEVINSGTEAPLTHEVCMFIVGRQWSDCFAITHDGQYQFTIEAEKDMAGEEAQCRVYQNHPYDPIGTDNKTMNITCKYA